MTAAVLVFGRSGQLAQELAQLSSSERPILTVGRQRCDLSAGADPAALIAEHSPALVINAAAYTGVDKAESEPHAAQALNCHAPGFIARACATARVPFIHMSTDYVFGGDKGSPYTEADPRRPLNVYGASKAAGEDAVQAAGGRSAIVRVAWLYSAFGSNFPKTMLRLASSRDEIRVVGDQRGRPTSARFVAEQLMALGERMIHRDASEKGVFHLSLDGEATWAEFAEEVFARSAAIGGPSAKVTAITTSEHPTLARRPADSRLDPSKLEAVLQASFPDWRQALDVDIAAIVAAVPELARA